MNKGRQRPLAAMKMPKDSQDEHEEFLHWFIDRNNLLPSGDE